MWMDGQQVPVLEGLLVSAGEALEALRLDEALSLYEAAEREDPEAYLVHVGLARTHTRMRRQAEAVASAERAMALDSHAYEAYALRGALHFLVDENEEAQEVLERALELAPNEPEARLTLAQVLADVGRSEDADEMLAEARGHIEALPAEAERLRWMAMALHAETYVHLARGSTTEALAAAQQVTEMEDANPYAACLAYSNMGIIQARQRKYDLGIEYLQEALRLNPYFHRAGSALGRLLLVRRRASEAADVLERVLAQAPQESGSTRYAYATALAKSGQRLEALAQYRLATDEGLRGADAVMARIQRVWLSTSGRYAVLGVLLVAVLAWLVLAQPSPQTMTFVVILAMVLILQRTVGRRRR
jgi:tetratricopeptide (TPR) repeat protein